MRLNNGIQISGGQSIIGTGEAWERSSIASGFTSAYGGSQMRVDIKASLSALPAPKNDQMLSIKLDQIARLEADIEMLE